MCLINCLPDDVLISIFQNLTPKMIKSCCLVCKRWDSIVGSSYKLMGNFKLVLKSSEDWKKSMGLKRKHQQIYFKYCNLHSMNSIMQHNIHTLEMIYYQEMELSAFTKLMNNLPKLKILKTNYVDLIDDIQHVHQSKKVFTKLEHLDCKAEICHIFNCNTLSSLKLIWSNSITNEKRSVIFEFLKNQKNLVEFRLIELGNAKFFNNQTLDLEMFDFRLESFQYSTFIFDKYQELIRFLAPHAHSLIELDIDFITEFEMLIPIEQVQKYILESLPNLKYLEMEMHVDTEVDSVEENSFFMEVDEPRSATCVTKNIEHLKYRDCHRTPDETKRFIDMFPNIKHLGCHTYFTHTYELLIYVSLTKVNLESLEMYLIDDIEEVKKLYFPKLKKFRVWDVEIAEDGICYFIKRHSEVLEEINITYADELTEKAVNEIVKCKNINRISLGLSEKHVKSMMNMFHVITSTSKPLTIRFGNVSTKYKYKFPEDKIFWDEQLKSFE
ncbi:uncharacterized protein [Chironomus tepperi]|uniref:uncharacterized protein n=1 Tax=Chironomus tepperi TaxID=113505 RepID=UPI00391F9770